MKRFKGSDVAMPLTLHMLEDHMASEEFGAHVWVKDLETGYVYAAITDMTDADGIVAVWAVDRYFREADYEKTWVAYLERPK